MSCAGCSNTENLKRFGEDLYCEECVGDGMPVCGECHTTGEHDMGCVDVGGLNFCGGCSMVEVTDIIEWDDVPCS